VAFPTTPILDDFNRANSPSLGVNWTQAAGNTEVAGNACIATGGGANAVLWAPTTFGPNFESYYTISTAIPDGNSIAVGAIRNGTFNGYATVLDAFAGNDTVKIERYTGGAPTVLVANGDHALAVGDIVGYWCNGTTHQSWIRKSGIWTLVHNISDSMYTGNTDFRLLLTMVRTQPTSGAIDDYGGGNEVLPGPVGIAKHLPTLHAGI
jgi:hypothetical protein